MGSRLRDLAGLLAVVVLALGLGATSAFADVEIGSKGSGAGQVLEPRGVAVDRSEGLLYVADNGNSRIDVFNADTGEFIRAFGWGVADGTANALQVCTATCFRGSTGSGAGQFRDVRGLAVDNDPSSPAFHDFYVFDNGNHRVQRFTSSGAFVWTAGDGVNKTTSGDLCTAASGNVCGAGAAGDGAGQINNISSGGLALGPGGVVHVADRVGSEASAKSRVQRYEPSGAYASGLALEVPGGAGNMTGFAVDSTASFYIATGGATGAVRKYGPSGTELFRRMPSFNVNGLGVDADDNLFASDNSGTGVPLSGIYEFDPAGTQIRTFYSTSAWRLVGLAPYAAASEVIFGAEESNDSVSGVRQFSVPPPGPVVLPVDGATAASEVGNTKATLKALVNPEGKATTYHFEYISDEDFKVAGESFGVGTVKTAETPLPGAFTFAAAELCREAAAGKVNVECELRDASANLTGLASATLYRFRVVASNADGGERVGLTGSFKTKDPFEFGDAWSTAVSTDSVVLHAEGNPLGIAATGYFEYVDEASFKASGFDGARKAPDVDGGAAPFDFGAGEAVVKRAATIFGLAPGTGYRYRLVVVNHCKGDPEVLCTVPGQVLSFATFAASAPSSADCPANVQLRTGPAAFLPDCRGYELVSPVNKNGADVEALYNISGFRAGLDQAAVDGQSIAYSTYKAFGPVDSAPYVSQYIARRDPGSGWASEAISPKRQGPSLMTFQSANLERQYQAFGADLCDGWLVQDAAPVLAAGGVEGYPGLYRRKNCGADTSSYQALTATAPPNLLPARFQPELQGTSADGAVAVFSVRDNLTIDSPPQPSGCLNDLDNQAECRSRLYEAREGQLKLVCILPDGSASGGSCGAGRSGAAASRSGSLSHAISADGSRIFWTTGTEDPGLLYVRIDGTETLQISSVPAQFWTAAADGSKAIYTVGDKLFSFDVDAETPNLIAEGTSGVAGASDDASRIYFASTKVLADGASAGRANLYLYEAGGPIRLVATLSGSEMGQLSAVSRFPVRRVSRVSADGQRIAFMSSGSLTGYDNTDAVSGMADAEVFLYDSTANAGAGVLRCVSCNPSGARPVGKQLTQKLSEGVWAAARIPVYLSQLYGSRVLSEDGSRLYFNSFEGLVSRDTNGQEDVYQWEAPGKGNCTSARPTYSESAGGCVELISSGESPQGSELVDIGANGNDVFFKTSQSLVPQDPGLIDIYDARVNGGFPPPPALPAACEGEACAPPVAAPNDPTPASTAFRGPGNATAPAAARKACPKGKRKVRRAGKQRCAKQKQKKVSHRKAKRHSRRGAR